MSRRNDRPILGVVTNGLNGQRLTSLFQAKRYVARGLARWVGGALEFFRDARDHREHSAERLKSPTIALRAGGLPIRKRYATSRLWVRLSSSSPNLRHESEYPKGRTGPVKIVMRDGVMVGQQPVAAMETGR